MYLKTRKIYHPIGEYIVHDPPLEIDLDKTPVVMYFDNQGSIDAVIEELKTAKELLEKLSN